MFVADRLPSMEIEGHTLGRREVISNGKSEIKGKKE